MRKPRHAENPRNFHDIIIDAKTGESISIVRSSVKFERVKNGLEISATYSGNKYFATRYLQGLLKDKIKEINRLTGKEESKIFIGGELVFD